LFAATVCAADGREIFGNRWELQHCPSVRVFLSLSLSLLSRAFLLSLAS
jgi:hypothetical protein